VENKKGKKNKEVREVMEIGKGFNFKV